MALSSEFLSAIGSFVITLLILSYLIGDNPLFRAAIYIFVGVSAGYVTAVAWNQVIYPLLLQPILSGSIFSNIVQAILLAFPLIGSALLLTKASPKLSHLGQIPVAYLAGVGAAVAIGGATLGTLFPQITATFNSFDLGIAELSGAETVLLFFNSIIVLVGVVGTLAYFHYGARQKADGSVQRNIFIIILTWVGRVYIAVTLGVLFAGVYMAALTALIERVDSIRNFIMQLF